MIEVLFAVAVFTGVILALVGLILLARARLVPTGVALATVNGERELELDLGDKLLVALAERGIRLPSACGGKGTCGQCRLKVLRGGGPVIPTEVSVLGRREVGAGVRLACQVTVREDLELEVPEAVFGVRQWTCRVRSSRFVATLIKEVVLELPEGESLAFRAGSFVEVTCPAYTAKFRDFEVDPAVRDEWDRMDLWRYEAGTHRSTTRAYSLANYPDEDDVAMLVVRIATPPPGSPERVPAGVVSSWIFALRPGDAVEIAGPFGNFAAIESDAEMVFVGGGAGMAPMRSLILDQLLRLKTRRKITFWYGARSRRELFYAEEFDELAERHPNFEWRVALSEPRPEDEWTGDVGFIHEVLLREGLADHPSPEDCEYYLCGPPMMTRAVRVMLDRLGVDPDHVRFDDFGS